jgi:hypothetical protein
VCTAELAHILHLQRTNGMDWSMNWRSNDELPRTSSWHLQRTKGMNWSMNWRSNDALPRTSSSLWQQPMKKCNYHSMTIRKHGINLPSATTCHPPKIWTTNGIKSRTECGLCQK